MVSPRKIDADTLVFGAFGAILQGDQLGVEIGIDSHAGLLKSYGLLGSDENLVSSRLVRPSDVHQGLVIDDYFAIAQVSCRSAQDSR